MGRYYSYLLPKQARGTPQILVDKTSPMTGRLRVYNYEQMTPRASKNLIMFFEEAVLSKFDYIFGCWEVGEAFYCDILAYLDILFFSI